MPFTDHAPLDFFLVIAALLCVVVCQRLSGIPAGRYYAAIGALLLFLGALIFAGMQ
jgi:energy-coupling factor transporter transmembrane protein EcfT